MPDTAFIINPCSNGGKALRDWQKIRPLVKEFFPHSQTLMTNGPGDATAYSKSLLENHNIKKIISVGGDGTNNEIIQSFFDKDHKLKRSDCLFGLFPLGTGCDFSRTLKIPKNPRQSLQILNDGQNILCDVGYIKFLKGEIAERYFLNAFSFGLSGFSATLINEKGHKKSKFSYFSKSIQSLFKYKPQTVELSTEDKALYEGPMVVVALANGKYFAAGMKLAPEADLQSGCFQTILVRDGRKRDLVKKFFSVYLGKHIDGNLIQLFNTSFLKTSTTDHILSEYDGEEGPPLPFEAKCIKQVLPLIVPEGFV
tara:strand:- start:7093 stop:8025 length:933 start_codon:yes stop_codon:yes gene_type:complete